MKEETKKWLLKSKQDLKVAKDNFKLKHYEYCAFLCQQSAEKALKAVSIEKKGEVRKIHDLVELGKDANLSSNLLEFCKEMTLAYTFSRYPDIEGVNNIRESASKFLKNAEEILKWIERNL